MKTRFRRLSRIFEACWLCTRFPFLYPRNRFTGKHYNNWKLLDKKKSIYNKWYEWSKKHQKDYFDKFGEQSVILFGETVMEYDEEILNRCYVRVGYIMKLATITDRFLYWWCGFANSFLGVFHFIPTYTELDGMPSGWRKRFGIDFCKELKRAILHSGGKEYMKKFRIMDIKEKYGTLRVYVDGGTPEVNRVIEKYEYISQYVCICCGEDAYKTTMGWIENYCDDCLPKNRRWKWIDPVYGWSNYDHKKENEKIDEELP